MSQQVLSNLGEVQRRYADEAACLALLERSRWPNGVVCRHCGAIDRASRISTRPGQFTCLECHRQFSVTAGTAMHKTRTPLSVWLTAMYLIETSCQGDPSRRGVSALKLSHCLGIQYRTAWHMVQRIRTMMVLEPGLLKGVVASDDSNSASRTRDQNQERAAVPPRPGFHADSASQFIQTGGV